MRKLPLDGSVQESSRTSQKWVLFLHCAKRSVPWRIYYEIMGRWNRAFYTNCSTCRLQRAARQSLHLKLILSSIVVSWVSQNKGQLCPQNNITPTIKYFHHAVFSNKNVLTKLWSLKSFPIVVIVVTKTVNNCPLLVLCDTQHKRPQGQQYQ